ncbi:hypothetical protein CO657_03615 [Rhizobium acidisoli]|uniref:Uncharacterized protein n=1 Tax=Rhizobium acidisoli TaxID=1538158 RepID=A0AAE5TSY1_9HYPH|nr:hypothetical protein CO657_03615 [Rhizobium acidisoli]
MRRGRRLRQTLGGAASCGTPLCPAGHLPHKEGDRQEAHARSFSALATIRQLRTSLLATRTPPPSVVLGLDPRTHGHERCVCAHPDKTIVTEHMQARRLRHGYSGQARV